MIDARVDAERGATAVHMIGPGAAPMLQQRRCIPFADLAAEPVAIDLAQAQHDMGVGFGLAIGPDIPMDVEVGAPAAVETFARSEPARARGALSLPHLAHERGTPPAAHP